MPDDGGSPLTGIIIQMAAPYMWTWFPYPCPSSADASSVELFDGLYWLFPLGSATSITLADCASIGAGGTYDFRVMAVSAFGPAGFWGFSGPAARVTTDPPTPATTTTSASTSAAITSIRVGQFHTCAQQDDGSLKCWGKNDLGQLGQGHTNTLGDDPGEMGDNLPVVDLGTGKTVASFDSGGDHGSCVILNDSTVKCWGRNGKGQLGQGHTNNLGDDPGEMGDNLPVVDLGTGKTATALSAGDRTLCALLNDGSVKCWGMGYLGSLGDGDSETHSVGDEPGEMGDNLAAIDLGTGRTATAIAARGHHNCALLDDGTVKCWGYNYLGHLGLGDTQNRGDDPGEMGDNLPAVDLGTGKAATAITVGYDHTCALLADGSVKCWGHNGFGQLGQGHTNALGDDPDEMGDNLPPIDLGTGKSAVAINAGRYHTCALLDDGSAKCWGGGSYGLLGTGNQTSIGLNSWQMGDNLSPIDLGAGKSAVAIEAGHRHTCALLNDATVKCFGDAWNGQLGQGDQDNLGDGPGEMGDNLPIVDLGS